MSAAPFYMLVCGALLTAFYMTRQVSYVFFGNWRGHGEAHESPSVMLPLVILAFFADSAFLVPAWPLFSYLSRIARPSFTSVHSSNAVQSL